MTLYTIIEDSLKYNSKLTNFLTVNMMSCQSNIDIKWLHVGKKIRKKQYFLAFSVAI